MFVALSKIGTFYAMNIAQRYTVDIRALSMLRLQETKRGLADAALGEEGGIKLHKLSVKELKAVCCVPDPSILSDILFPFAIVVWNEPKRGR